LYVGYDTYLNIPKPATFRTFFILRDPRDTVISWYFSAKKSHIPVHPIPQLRTGLEKLNQSDGLRYIIDQLGGFGSFDVQRSWMNTQADKAVAVFRYESLVQNPEAFIKQLLGHLNVDLPAQLFNQLLARFSFERFSGGRKPGEEDTRSHYRKGIVGDWKNYFDDRVIAHFQAKTGDLLKVLGYEK